MKGFQCTKSQGSALNCRVSCVGYLCVRGKPIQQAMMVWKKTRDFGCQRLGRVLARKQQCSRWAWLAFAVWMNTHTHQQSIRIRLKRRCSLWRYASVMPCMHSSKGSQYFLSYGTVLYDARHRCLPIAHQDGEIRFPYSTSPRSTRSCCPPHSPAHVSISPTRSITTTPVHRNKGTGQGETAVVAMTKCLGPHIFWAFHHLLGPPQQCTAWIHPHAGW